MEKRKPGKHTVPAHLLMTSERHLPGRKSEKGHAFRTQISPGPAHELFLVVNMFYHIVTQNQVKLSLKLLHFKNIRCQKLPVRIILRKEPPGICNFASSHIHTHDRTACLGKRQQIATFSASDFQYIYPFSNPKIFR